MISIIFGKQIFQQKNLYKSLNIHSQYLIKEIYQTVMSFDPQDNLPVEEIEKKNQQEPEQLLLAREPQDELIDFGEIGGFMREKNDDLGHSMNFSHHDNHLYPHEQNFDDKHNNQRHLMYQHQLQNEQQNKYAYQHQQNGQNNYSANQQQFHQVQEAPNSSKKQTFKRKCICKKTQCLKMYCECFASNLPCTDQCTCLSCKNTLEHQKQIIEAKMLIQQKGIVGLHSCSLSEKRCNCKKSGCLKKYCECYNSGVKCTPACKCVECKNCANQNEDNSPMPQVQQKKSRVKKSKRKDQKLSVNSRN